MRGADHSDWRGSTFATHSSWDALRVGISASVCARISMGFAEALADGGELSGRGTLWMRGAVCGLVTVAGGVGHTSPYLIPSFRSATGVASAVLVLELFAIAWVQWKYMDAPPVSPRPRGCWAARSCWPPAS